MSYSRFSLRLALIAVRGRGAVGRRSHLRFQSPDAACPGCPRPLQCKSKQIQQHHHANILTPWSCPCPCICMLTMSTALWDTQSTLLLVQLIYKYGDPYTQSSTPHTQKDTTFETIAQQLTHHTLIRPSKRKYTANLCEQHYIDLLAQENLTRELSLPTSASANKKRIPLPVPGPSRCMFAAMAGEAYGSESGGRDVSSKTLYCAYNAIKGTNSESRDGISEHA